MSFVEFIVIGLKSNRTNKTNNQNPSECILTTDKIRSNGIWLFDFNQIEPIVQLTTSSAKLNSLFTRRLIQPLNSVCVHYFTKYYVQNMNIVNLHSSVM